MTDRDRHLKLAAEAIRRAEESQRSLHPYFNSHDLVTLARALQDCERERSDYKHAAGAEGLLADLNMERAKGAEQRLAECEREREEYAERLAYVRGAREAAEQRVKELEKDLAGAADALGFPQAASSPPDVQTPFDAEWLEAEGD